VLNEVTAEAMAAFTEHFDRIVREPPSEAELADAKRYLVDRFPLRIETPDKIAALLAELRIYGLPNDYWDTFGDRIEQVTAQAALQAAQKYIHPERSLIVVVGEGTAVRPALERYGAVTVVDTEGSVVVKPAPAAASATPSSAATPAPGSSPAPAPKPSAK
jgi:zinc protease